MKCWNVETRWTFADFDEFDFGSTMDVMSRKKVTLIVSLIPLLACLSGCYRPLFDAKLPRNQFSQHDAARDGETPMEGKDAFGNTQPALRQRLMTN